MGDLDPIVCTVFLILSLSTAGVFQVAWLRTRVSEKLKQRVDFGLTLRGRPLLGENKTLRGFVVMVPASGFSFWAWSRLGSGFEGLWPLSPTQFLLLGCAAGAGFMLGELPNSALKRQLDIAPGEAPTQPWLGRLCLTLDRTDSLLGSLLAMSLTVPVPWPIWLGCLVVGSGIHGLFSFALYRLGIKERAG
jgi:hypothetical protein